MLLSLISRKFSWFPGILHIIERLTQLLLEPLAKFFMVGWEFLFYFQEFLLYFTIILSQIEILTAFIWSFKFLESAFLWFLAFPHKLY